MTPQQKCAERIYELLPHKKELEFGCEIKIIDYSGFGLLDKDAQNRELLESFDGYATVLNYFIDYSPRDYDGSPDRDDIVYFQLLVDGMYVELIDVICEDYIEIIGLPIRIADILLAVKIKHNELFNTSETEDGYKEFSFSGDLIDILSMYNLEKDNILDQSDEFCEFLSEILK